jgi:fatty acid synthase
VQNFPAAIQAGMRLAHPPPGEEVVISGVAGYFSDSSNVYHLRDNLKNKVDMLTDDDRRWKHSLYMCLLIFIML